MIEKRSILPLALGLAFSLSVHLLTTRAAYEGGWFSFHGDEPEAAAKAANPLDAPKSPPEPPAAMAKVPPPLPEPEAPKKPPAPKPPQIKDQPPKPPVKDNEVKPGQLSPSNSMTVRLISHEAFQQLQSQRAMNFEQAATQKSADPNPLAKASPIDPTPALPQPNKAMAAQPSQPAPPSPRTPAPPAPQTPAATAIANQPSPMAPTPVKPAENPAKVAETRQTPAMEKTPAKVAAAPVEGPSRPPSEIKPVGEKAIDQSPLVAMRPAEKPLAAPDLDKTPVKAAEVSPKLINTQPKDAPEAVKMEQGPELKQAAAPANAKIQGKEPMLPQQVDPNKGPQFTKGAAPVVVPMGESGVKVPAIEMPEPGPQFKKPQAPTNIPGKGVELTAPEKGKTEPIPAKATSPVISEKEGPKPEKMPIIKRPTAEDAPKDAVASLPLKVDPNAKLIDKTLAVEGKKGEQTGALPLPARPAEQPGSPRTDPDAAMAKDRTADQPNRVVETPVTPAKTTDIRPAAQNQKAVTPSPTTPPAARPTPGAPSRPTPVERTASESAPVTLVQNDKLRPGSVISAQGVKIQTVHPRFSIVTMATAVPQNPVVDVDFDASGKVTTVTFRKSSGYESVDGPLLAALYKMTATGNIPKSGFRIKEIRIILGGR